LAGKVTARLAESNGSLLLCEWLKDTCRLTACTSGLAPGPTLGNEYGRTLPFYKYKQPTVRALLVNVSSAFDVWSSCLFRGWSNGLEPDTPHDPTGPTHLIDSLRHDLKTLYFPVY